MKGFAGFSPSEWGAMAVGAVPLPAMAAVEAGFGPAVAVAVVVSAVFAVAVAIMAWPEPAMDPGVAGEVPWVSAVDKEV